MPNRKPLGGSIVRASALAAALGCACAVNVSGAQAVHVRLASSANDDVTPVLYAQASGLFRAAGLEVDLQAVNNGAAVAAAVAGGAVDIGRSSLLPLIGAHAHGVPLVLVGPSGEYTGAQTSTGGILVTKDSPVHGGRDLNGKIVSVPGLNDILDLGTRAWIDKDGGDAASIRFVETRGSEVSVALDGGRVAAATLVNPLMAQDLASGKYRLLGDPLSGIAPRLLEAAWFANVDYATKHAATLRAFDAVLRKASIYCNGHPQQTIDVLTKFSGIDVMTIAHMVRARYALTLDPREIQPIIDAAARYKVIGTPFAAREMIATFGQPR